MYWIYYSITILHHYGKSIWSVGKSNHSSWSTSGCRCNNILMLSPVVRNAKVCRLKRASLSLPVQPSAQSRAHFKVRPWPFSAKFCNLWGQRFHSVVHWPWQDTGYPPKPPCHSPSSAEWRRESITERLIGQDKGREGYGSALITISTHAV